MKLSELRKMISVFPAEFDPKDVEQRSIYLQQMGFDPGGIYQELEMESRFVDTHQDISFANTQVGLHSHSFYELLYCCNSCGAEYLVGAERYRLQKGDIILVPPGLSHRPLLPEHMPEPYKRVVLWISTEFMNGLRQDFPEMFGASGGNNVLLRTADTPWEGLGELFYSGLRAAEAGGEEWQMLLVGNTLTLLAQIRRAFADRGHTLQAEKPELLDRVLAYVEAHLSERITLERIARHFYISESTISQTFRKKMGVSFYRCVTQRRLIAAKELIAGGTALEAVSNQVGFMDYSTFYRAFRQEYGISPRQYRSLQEASMKKSSAL